MPVTFTTRAILYSSSLGLFVLNHLYFDIHGKSLVDFDPLILAAANLTVRVKQLVAFCSLFVAWQLIHGHIERYQKNIDTFCYLSVSLVFIT